MADLLSDGTTNVWRLQIGKWVLNVIRNTDEYIAAGGPSHGVYMWDYKELKVDLVGNARSETEAMMLVEIKKRELATTLLVRALELDNDN